VVDGAIVGTAISEAPPVNSFLRSEKVFGDFILEMEIKQEGLSNGGIQFRSETRDGPMGRVFGYQFEIDPSDRAWTGGIYDEARRGWLYPGTLNPAGQKAYKYGQWNKVRIEAIGNSLRTWVNDQPVAHVVDDVTSRGFIALQVHGIQNPNQVGFKTSWRNIQIQTTDLKASPAVKNQYIRNAIPNNVSAAEKAQGWELLWDGKTSKGWRGAKQAKFPDKGWQMVNGEILVADNDGKEGFGGGDIVTEKEYSAFEFEVEFLMPAANANSGLKYFVQESLPPVPPGNSAIGIEFQITGNLGENPIAAGANASAFGSAYLLYPRSAMPGGLNVVPRLKEWQHARIVVHPDNRVEHWLNGVKVVEYVRGSPDFKKRVAETKFKDIPGFGEWPKGRLLIQEHGREIKFRSIKVRELK
jgi:hypothetical protein